MNTFTKTHQNERLRNGLKKLDIFSSEAVKAAEDISKQARNEA
jgi:hypothetical protein